MKFQDERVVQIQQAISSKAFSICLISLWAIMIFRQHVLHQSPGEYADILLLTISVSFYVLYNNVIKGVFIVTKRKVFRGKFISAMLSIVYSVVFVLAFRFLTGIDDPYQLGTALVIVIIIRIAIPYLGKVSVKISEKDIES